MNNINNLSVCWVPVNARVFPDTVYALSGSCLTFPMKTSKSKAFTAFLERVYDVVLPLPVKLSLIVVAKLVAADVPIYGINYSYALIVSTLETQTSTELAVSDITVNASPLWRTNFAPPSSTCNEDEAGIGTFLTR